MKTLKISALALFSVLSFAACGDDGGTGPGGLREGRFEGDVSGELDIRLDGQAESGDYFNSGDHDVIVLYDAERNIEIGIRDTEGEFNTGRRTIENEDDFDSRYVAYLIDYDTNDSYGSVSGTLDLDRVTSGGVEGAARFTAEHDDFSGEFVTVDVIFNTDYNSNIFSLSRSPSLSRSAKK